PAPRRGRTPPPVSARCATASRRCDASWFVSKFLIVFVFTSLVGFVFTPSVDSLLQWVRFRIRPAPVHRTLLGLYINDLRGECKKEIRIVVASVGWAKARSQCTLSPHERCSAVPTLIALSRGRTAWARRTTARR